jgi:methyl-accepting chemotaxis protein
MSEALDLLTMLPQAVTGDTLVARLISERGVLEWTNGILQFIVLVLGVVGLVIAVWLLMTVRQSVNRLNVLMEQFAVEVRPLVARATEVVSDTREVVAMLRTDVERVTGAASEVSAQLLRAADITATRVDEVNAVLEVLQTEVEHTALDAASTMRGLAAGTRALLRPRRRKRRANVPDEPEDPSTRV